MHLNSQLGTKREAQVAKPDKGQFGQRRLDRAAGRRLHICSTENKRLFKVPLLLKQFINGDCRAGDILRGISLMSEWIPNSGENRAARPNGSITDLKNSANLWVHHSSGEHQISANLDIGIRNFDACLFELDA
ncbi:MAG: Uncharacterised protein [Synechococcus sp. MIT S9220]|nr:MAG: Uncharacterised protein [Synechococcus sp. MIT S9220]